MLEASPQAIDWEFLQAEALHGAEQPAVILVVDRLEINRRLLRSWLRTEGHRILETPSATEALQILEQTKVDLVILDLMMPETSGLDFCRRMKANRKTHLLPVLMVTSVQGVENEVAGIAAGADAFLTRPLHPSVVRTRIASMLRRKAATDSLEEAESVLFALAQMLEQRDSAMSGHCERLDAISMTLGTALNLSRSQLLSLHRGAYLHDIGKGSIPDAVLFKPGPLTKQENAIMRLHPLRGEEICRHVKSLAPVLPIIRNHHERWDGSGYPDGLAGEQIPLLARVLQVADIFDALTSPRPYKRAVSRTKALDILEREARRGWREPELVRLFRELSEHSLCTVEEGSLLPSTPAESIRQSLENMRAAVLTE